MAFEFDPIYLIYICVAAAAVLLVEGIYLLCFSGVSYRQNVNRRLKLLKDEPNRENILVQLRRERGLTGAGDYSIGFEAFNKLLLQSGLTMGLSKLLTVIALGALIAFGATYVIRNDIVQAHHSDRARFLCLEAELPVPELPVCISAPGIDLTFCSDGKRMP